MSYRTHPTALTQTQLLCEVQPLCIPSHTTKGDVWQYSLAQMLSSIEIFTAASVNLMDASANVTVCPYLAPPIAIKIYIDEPGVFSQAEII